MQNNFSCEKKKAEILVYRGLRIIPEYFFLRGEEKKKGRIRSYEMKNIPRPVAREK